MSTEAIPESVVPLLWDVDASTIELERDRALIFERVMSRGSWAAMRWLRGRYAKPLLADFVRGEGRRKLAPRDLAYWALVCDVELPSSPGGGRRPLGVGRFADRNGPGRGTSALAQG